MLLHAALKSTPERRATNQNWSTWEGFTRNTARSWGIALNTMKELEKCLKKLDRGVSRKRRNWAMQQQAALNKLELGIQLGWMWEKLLLENFRNEMRPTLICPTPDDKLLHPDSASVFVHVVLGWSCTGRSDLMWQAEVRGRKLARVPDDDAVFFFKLHLSQRQSVEQQIKIDSLEKGFTRNTARSWWIALNTMKELEKCLKKLDRGVTRKRRNWAMQEKAALNKLELGSQLGWTWEKMLLEHFENETRPYLICPTSDGKPFHPDWGSVNVNVHVVLGWSCIGRSEIMWQTEIRGQNPACVPDNVAVCCFMQHLSQHQSVGQQILWEGTHEEHFSFLVDWSGYDEIIR